MPLLDSLQPTQMSRVAIVAPNARLRQVLLIVADAGVIEVEAADGPSQSSDDRRLDKIRSRYGVSLPRDAAPPSAVLALEPPAPSASAAPDAIAALLGEVELEGVTELARVDGGVSALVGWCPTASAALLAARLSELGGAVVALPRPVGSEPPTLVEPNGATRAFQPLVDTYAALPYEDLDPAAVVGLTYAVMFGMMFGDVGHGAVLVLAGVLLAYRCPSALTRFRDLSPFVIAAGAASCGFGLAFGEMFGPTHIVPTLWLSPLDHVTTLIAVAVGAGAGLLTLAYALGTVNRWREGGMLRALRSTSGAAGAFLYLGLAAIALGWYRHVPAATATGVAIAAVSLCLAFGGMFRDAGGHLSGALQAGVETFDSVIRIGTNTISFARLAAFGLTHAALSGLAWSATTALWHRGPLGVLAGVFVFSVGNTVAFLLEGLVAGLQALRLEYYELFSRILVREGRQFHPWHVPTVATKES